ncbi:PAS domain S-box protein [Pedosphaera parvula]|uniref:histidine kinase n=1 Tax=Pedosphaera parvula (strain Ellin514) TaxID=320771 RepID=B9XMM0_PEDPL|nr:PAS domain S-box protein [Pedosphaera parvula]EEF58919.1 PAS/PAC sensor signal transduction histidine kinase [Pedosphaera parvula Ellin514]
MKNEQGESYTLYTPSGVPREAFAKIPMPRNTALFGPTFRGERVIRIGDVLQDPRYGKSAPHHGMPKGHLPVRSYLAVPVFSRSGEVLGGLFYGHSAPNIFTSESEATLRTLASQAGMAVDNANLYSTLHRELADQKRAQQSSQLLASIVESSDDAIISKDLNGIITSWNAGAQKLFGYTAAEAIGQPITIVFPAERLNEEEGILARIRRGERIDHYETIRQHKDGTRIDISLTASPIKDADGRIIGASKIARDIRERRQAEEALQEANEKLARANQELESRVSERTASLQQALSQMEEFSYSVSHDLRAPVRAMQGYARVLMEDFSAQLGQKGTDYLDRIMRSGVRMDRLIQEVLTFSRLARTEIELKPVSLEKLLPDIVHAYPQLQPPHAEIIIKHPLLMMHGHEPSLTQAISNLLNNAAKFVAPGVKPKIHLWTEQSGDRVRLWIEDNGIGIKPDYQARLFGLFQRIHGETIYEGTGIGLAIVRKAADRMGGKAGCVSDGVSGSKFWIELKAVQ